MPRTLSDHWTTLRPRLTRFQTWVTTREWSRVLILLLCLIAAVAIARMVVRKAATGKELADLISALASLAWPIVALVIVSWFRPEIRAILTRLRKGKLLGTEFELDELNAKTEAAEAKLPSITGTASGTLGDIHLEATGTVGPAPAPAQDEIEDVLREAARSPRVGLLLLSTKIERAASELAAKSPTSTVDVQLTAEDEEALILFNRVRNRLVHGHDADEEDVARAIDSGTRLLRVLVARLQTRPETPGPNE